MQLELLTGRYDLQDGYDVLSQQIHSKIHILEQKIMKDMTEDDIELTERKIFQLTNDLHHIKIQLGLLPKIIPQML